MESSLAQAEAAFSHRRARGKYCGRLSNKLKSMALALLERHTYAVVSKATNISPQLLKDWKKASTAKMLPEENIAFVTLPVTEVKAPLDKRKSKKHATGLTLLLPQGMQLRLPEQPLPDTIQLICALAEELSTCSI